MRRNKTPKYAATLAEYARIEGVSRATATRRDQSGQIVRNDGGQIDIVATRQIVRELSGTATDPRVVEARLKILQAEGRLRELRLREKEGTLIETNSVESATLNSFAGVKTALRGLVPWLASELMAMDRETDMRRLCYQIDERLDVLIFNAYVVLARSLAEIANRTGTRAEKMAAEAWKAAFPSDWQVEYDRLEQSGAIDRTGPDNKPSRSDRKRKKR